MQAFANFKEELEKKIPSNYAEAKKQSCLLDDLLGFQCDRIEKKLLTEQSPSAETQRQFWIGLDLQSLQTPYAEIAEMVHHLDPKPSELWMDLGAAYGRMGLVMAALRPQTKFLGVEFVKERVEEGLRIFQNFGLQNAQLIRADLAADDFILPDANVYFLYDTGSKSDVYKILEKLRLVSARRPVQVVARGRGVRHWILLDFPWLGEIQRPEHFDHWSVFRS